MSFFDKFKGVINGGAEEEYVDDYEGNYDAEEEEANTPSQRQSAKEQPRDTRTSGGVSMSGVSLEMKVVKPDKFEAVTQIGEHLLARRTVVLNLEETNKETIRRIIDFLSGVAFAIDGSIKRVANSTYVITPRNVEVSGDQPQARDDRTNQKELF
ncbi:MAG: hypothetical protein A2Y17_07875 [Clostridiales bacterium GWF2_38_85]|nr:MAG: hypothetical protein A2Y17_07875 [Clostridiales bacterium GWF2_38_85]HBL84206.1 cell division protein SepF [Clostridiales bacterium]